MYLLNKQHQLPTDTIKIWLSQFLVRKFIMKNTAVLLCSNIVLQEGGEKQFCSKQLTRFWQ